MPERYNGYRRRSSSRSSSASDSSSRSDSDRYRSDRRDRSRRSNSRSRRYRSRSPRRPRAEKSDHKSRICIHWERGKCTNGDDCKFAHGAHQLRAVQAGTWKTVLCNRFEKGICNRGSNCSFAHGEEELRDSYKTILCKYYETGNCKSGSDCKFAHGEKELVKLEPPKIEVKIEKPKETAEPSGDETDAKAEAAKSATKKVICRYWQNGFCNKGESCSFAHEGPQKEQPPPTQGGFKTVLCRYFGTPQGCSKGAECRFAHGAEELPAGSAASAQALEEVQQPAAPAFKTVLCKYFEQGHCSRGDECTYAHGIEELQTREAGTYKTVLCKFFEAGGCSRGASCTFAHGEEELITDAQGAAPVSSGGAVAATAFGTTSLADAIAQSTAGAKDRQVKPDQVVGSVGVLIQPTRLLSKRQLESSPAASKHPKIAEVVKPRARVMRCAFFVIGRCAKGEDCTYFHDTSAEVQTSADFAVAADTPVPEPEPVVPARVPKLVLPPRRLTVPPRVKEKEEEETVPVNEEVTAEWSEMPEEVTADWSEMQEVTAEWSEMPRFKTALCKFWQEGTCTNGENCTYAHGPEELQPLYKAKLCNFFQQGHCARGANCTFAHGVEELQDGNNAFPPMASAATDSANAAPFPRRAKLGILCKFWEQGICNRGDDCTFAHGIEELQATPDTWQSATDPVSSASTAASLASPPLPEPVAMAKVFKTGICRFWQEGTCPNGENCNYAHGLEELQPVYKAKLCSFFEQGHCARGANCTFAHGVDELQAMPDETTLASIPIPAAAVKYKTSLCAFYQQGMCNRGENCTFAHSVDELQAMPPEQMIVEHEVHKDF